MKDLIGKMSLYESAGEVDSLLKEALSLIMDRTKAQSGAAFVYNHYQNRLIFRVGYDRGDLWDLPRCEKNGAPLCFSPEDNDMEQTFSENKIRVLNSGDKGASNPYGVKLLIPITGGAEKIGVLVLAFGRGEDLKGIDKRELKGAVTHLGDMLVEASILIDRINREQLPIPRIIKGIKTSSGIAQGRALPIWTDGRGTDKGRRRDLPVQREKERESFHRSMDRSIEELEELITQVGNDDKEMASMIFTAQSLMLKDRNFIGKMESLIDGGESATEAVEQTIDEYVRLFSSMKEVRLAEKAQDVRDLGFRLINNLGEGKEESFSYRNSIIISRHIFPSDLYRFSLEGAAGIVLGGATVTAHISILARSLDIPVLMSDEETLFQIPEGMPLLLDADQGKLYVNPEEITRRAILDTSKKANGPGVFTIRGLTKNGTDVKVMANVNILKDAREAGVQGAQGIGLYRSEFPFILKNDFLSEEQQYRIYREIARSQRGKALVLRTADIGGDKLLRGRGDKENNPFLGVRGIRFSLANRGFFCEQLRAMLRAGAGEDLKILLPMVTDVEEVIQAKEEIGRCINLLQSEKIEHNGYPKIGAMIELPSAAMAIDDIMEETDFVSLGTNDLTMYLLAVDRTNDNLSHLYRSHHPAVLKVLADIIDAAVKKNQDISVCGDVAADPLMIPFLVGRGVRSLSVSPPMIEKVKRFLAEHTLEEMEEKARDMLAIKKLSEMERYRKRELSLYAFA